MSDTESNITPVVPSTLTIQQTEKQLWEIVKSVPGINVAYGSVRSIVYVAKHDKKESTDSLLGAAKGAIQAAAITASVFTAPITIPGILTGIVAKSVSDTTEILFFFVTNTVEFQDKTNDEREQIFYNKIKHVHGVGAFYSAIRMPIYLLKKNKQQSVVSGVGLVTNSGNAAVQVGVSFIPGVDGNLQKLIEKTASFAIKVFAKKVLEQVSQQNIALEQGVTKIVNIEDDLAEVIKIISCSDNIHDEKDDKISKPEDETHAVIRKNRIYHKFLSSCVICRGQKIETKKPLRAQHSTKNESKDALEKIIILTD